MDGEQFEVRDIRKKGVFILEDEFFNGYAKILSSQMLAVYICFCRHADKDQKCWPSQAKIAEELGLSESTIIDAIKVLELFRFIKKQRVGKKCTNRYWLLDKKYWRRDFEVILKSLSSGDIKELKLTTITLIVNNLNSYSSNSKETHSKETHSKEITKSSLQDFFLKGKYYEELKTKFCEKYKSFLVEKEFESFIDYWTESSGKKQRWEKQEVFELPRRLARWFKNHEEWSKEKEVINV